jgi:divalent metal cation (Fe/Co/Zn/Cd) transporter
VEDMDQRKIERSINYAKVSFYMNLVMAVGKMIVGLYTASIFLCIYALYNVGLALAKGMAVKGYLAGKRPPDETHVFGYGREEYKSYFRVGVILTTSSIVFIIYCLRLFLYGSSASYSMHVALAIAFMTFIEMGMAVRGSVVTIRKGISPAVSAIKLSNLAASLISLVLTQTAILSFTHQGDMSYYNGLAGLIFGGLSALIGVGMILHMQRVLNGKHYLSVKRKLFETVESCGANLSIEPVRYEDHGPRRKILYVHEIDSESREQYEEIKVRIQHVWDIEMIEVSKNAIG